MRAAATMNPGAEVRILEVPDPPSPDPGEVVIRIEASTINPADVAFARGSFRASHGPAWAGMEAVGTIVASGARAMEPGLRVLAAASFLPHGQGTHADLVHLGHNGRLWPLPVDLDPLTAVGLPVAAGAAMRALSLAELHPGGVLALTGAMGSVGRVVLACALSAGVEVLGVVRADDLAGARDLGCAHALTVDDIGCLEGAADVLIDAAAIGDGGTALVRRGGRVIGLRPFTSKREDVDQHTMSLGEILASDAVDRAFDALGAGVIIPLELESFAFADAAEAYRAAALPGRRGLRPVLIW